MSNSAISAARRVAASSSGAAEGSGNSSTDSPPRITNRAVLRASQELPGMRLTEILDSPSRLLDVRMLRSKGYVAGSLPHANCAGYQQSALPDSRGGTAAMLKTHSSMLTRTESAPPRPTHDET